MLVREHSIAMRVREIAPLLEVDSYDCARSLAGSNFATCQRVRRRARASLSTDEGIRTRQVVRKPMKPTMRAHAHSREL
jgi:hypothetical protein